MLPSSIPESLWAEFKKMRVRIRHPMTPYAETLILVKLEKWRLENQADVIAILNESIERGWSGVFLNGHGALQGKQVAVSGDKGFNSPNPVSPANCCICKRPLNGSFIYWRGEKKCHSCD